MKFSPPPYTITIIFIIFLLLKNNPINKWAYTTSLIIMAILLRIIVSFHPHSGQNDPPQYGDYEAQRHWMEITINLPITEWYKNSTSNNLLYWGLDYPPLQAYHSWFFGQISSFIEPSSVKLNNSHGYETKSHKAFMRLTVLVSDLLIMMPPLLKLSPNTALLALCLFYPALILIDHAHFQYNCCSLGLLLWATYNLKLKKYALSAIYFTLSLNFKQMQLYHSIPFFTILLKICLKENFFNNFLKISISVLLPFCVLWAPFGSSIPNVFSRLFPVNRGVFEDYVANFWCMFNIIYKIRENNKMVEICALFTILGALPSNIKLFLNPNFKQFQLTLINSALSFFLFSYQVHEKSILLVSVPVLVLSTQNPKYTLISFWFLMISTFSMFPLMILDRLVIGYFGLQIFYLVIFQLLFNISTNMVVKLSIFGTFIISLITLVFPVPKRLPFLFPLIISMYSFVHFLYFFIYFNYLQLFVTSVHMKKDK